MSIYLFTRTRHCRASRGTLVALTGFLTAIVIATAPASASSLTLSQALRSPDYVLLMRHATAPGIGDPSGYALGNCLSQRNLNEQGKQQAHQLGSWLRAQGVQSAKVFSSPWCRCIDTGTGLNFGAVTVEQSLGSFFHGTVDATFQTRELEKFVAKTLPSKKGEALILVSHQVNIQEYTGENVSSGDMILVKVDRAGKVIKASRFPDPIEAVR